MSRFIESGQRNVCMTLQKQVVIEDEHGAPKEVHLSHGEPLYGHAWMPTGEELVEANRLGVRNPMKVDTLFRDDITADDQLVFNGKTMKIASVVDVGERHAELLITGEVRP